MTLFQAMIYGIIQGLTEFMPVSSSGHLAILPHIFDIEDPGVVFDLAMHVGTALAVILYFFKDIKALLIETFYLGQIKKSNPKMRPFVINLWISTIGTVITALILKSFAESYGRDTNLIAFNLILFGVLMFVADKFCAQKKEGHMILTIRVKEALFIGISQAVALFPGVSRSGATLTISRFLGISRVEAARYSFLLSLPVILGGMLYKFKDFLGSDTQFDMALCLFGIGVSFIVGLITIHFFLQIIAKLGLIPFALYRIAFAIYIFLQF